MLKFLVTSILICIIGVCLGLQIKHLNTLAEDIPVTFPITYPLSYPITYSIANLTNLFTDDIFSIPTGATTSATTYVRAETETSLTFLSPDGTNTILIPAETIITRDDLSDFNTGDLGASYISTGILSGFGSNITAIRAIEWGITNFGLDFDRPITINMYVGDIYNGRTFGIVRSTSSSSGWTGAGIVYPGTCTIQNGICSFQTTKASYFAAAEETSISTANTSPSSGGSSSSNPSAPSCTNTAPSNSPDLFQIDSKSNSTNLYFTPAAGQVTNYYVSYGLTPGDQSYGVEFSQGYSSGALNFTINYLKPRTDYYFRIRAGNGCMPGSWSNEMKITTTTGKSLVKYYKNFAKKISSFLPKKTTTVSQSQVLGAVSPEKTTAPQIKTQAQILQKITQSIPTIAPLPVRTPTPTPTPNKKTCILFLCW